MANRHSLQRGYRRYHLGDFTGSAIHPTAIDWSNRVVINGGAMPSNTTISALSTFCYGIDSDGLTSAMVSLCFFPPDSVIAAITPVYKVAGNDPWTNTGFVIGDLSVNGLLGNGSSKYLNTGVNPNSAYGSDNSAALFIGLTACTGYATLGCSTTNGFSSAWVIEGTNSGTSYTMIGTLAQDITTTSILFPAFLCSSRTSSTVFNYYRGTTAAGWVTLGSQGATNLTSRPNYNMYCCAFNEGTSGLVYNGNQKVSFAGFSTGLSSAQGQALFNRFQTLRIALGGGYS
jgi:hypothetical protein